MKTDELTVWKIFDELSAFRHEQTNRQRLTSLLLLLLHGGQFLADFLRKELDFYRFDCDEQRRKSVKLSVDDWINEFWFTDFSRCRAEIGWKNKRKKNKLSLTTRKKRKPISSCRENVYTENFSTLILLTSTVFCISTTRKKKEK